VKKIKPFSLSLLAILFLLPGLLKATPPPGYVLTWSDEFNGADDSQPNPSYWNYDIGATGWGNNELERYTNAAANAHIISDVQAVDGKALAIVAIDTNPGSTAYTTVGRYTSARLNSAGKAAFQYGWLEANLKLPYGQGLWPAYWTLGSNIGSVGWPTCGETDIMEYSGNLPSRNQGSIHGPGYNGTAYYSLTGGQQFKDAYHTFAIKWTVNQIEFYVDDALYEIQTNAAAGGNPWVFNAPFFFILNVAVGGSYPGSPNGTSSFPQTMLVDYVRVYQAPTPTRTPTATPTATRTPTNTPTPCATCPPTPVLGPAPVIYPNPADGTGPVRLRTGFASTVDVRVQVFTLAYRKVRDETFTQVPAGGEVVLSLDDQWGKPLANGFYYEVVSSPEGRWIGKLLVTR